MVQVPDLLEIFERWNRFAESQYREFCEYVDEKMTIIEDIKTEGFRLIEKRKLELANAKFAASGVLKEPCPPEESAAKSSTPPSVQDSEIPLGEYAVENDFPDCAAGGKPRKSKIGGSRGTIALHCLSKGLQGRRSYLMRISSRPSMRVSVRLHVPNRSLSPEFKSPSMVGIRSSGKYYTCKQKFSDAFDAEKAILEVSEIPKVVDDGESLEEPIFSGRSRRTFVVTSESTAAEYVDPASVPLTLTPYLAHARKVPVPAAENKKGSKSKSSLQRKVRKSVAASKSARSNRTFKSAIAPKKKSAPSNKSSARKLYSQTKLLQGTTGILTPAEKKSKLDEKDRRVKAVQHALEAEAKRRLSAKKKQREERMEKVRILREQKEEIIAKARAESKAEKGPEENERYEAYLEKKRLETLKRERMNLKLRMEKEEAAKREQHVETVLSATFTVATPACEPNVQPGTSKDFSNEGMERGNANGEDDYNIKELNSDESTDEESRPKKKIPSWATGKVFQRLLLIQARNAVDVEIIFPKDELLQLPNLAEICGPSVGQRYRQRTSSAHWDSPPQRDHVPLIPH